MDTNDEKLLQSLLESNLSEAGVAGTGFYNSEDVATYIKLFKLLNDKPDGTLPTNFSDDIVANLQARRDCHFDFKWNFLLPIVMLLFLAVAYFVFLYGSSTLANQLLRLFEQFKWYFLFATICFFAVQYFDHRFRLQAIDRGHKYS